MGPEIGETIKLVCPIPCDDLDELTEGVVVERFGENIFMVRFPGGLTTVVCRVEFTPH
jgi:hypothetical protein